MEHLFRAKGQIDIPFTERDRDQCAWPSWDKSQKGGAVCGLTTRASSSYCPYHAKVSSGLIVVIDGVEIERTAAEPPSGTWVTWSNHLG